MKLCDLDEIKICVNRQYENCHGYSGNKKAIYREAILAVKSILHSAKPIDAVPVRHGQWEKKSGLYSCSECGMTCPYDVQADVIEYWACNYCPNCGAKMDGGDNNIAIA